MISLANLDGKMTINGAIPNNGQHQLSMLSESGCNAKFPYKYLALTHYGCKHVH